MAHNPEVAGENKPTNLYLNNLLVAEGRTVAKARYGISLSDLIERLLKKELTLKRGAVHATVALGTKGGAK